MLWYKIILSLSFLSLLFDYDNNSQYREIDGKNLIAILEWGE